MIWPGTATLCVMSTQMARTNALSQTILKMSFVPLTLTIAVVIADMVTDVPTWLALPPLAALMICGLAVAALSGQRRLERAISICAWLAMVSMIISASLPGGALWTAGSLLAAALLIGWWYFVQRQWLRRAKALSSRMMDQAQANGWQLSAEQAKAYNDEWVRLWRS